MLSTLSSLPQKTRQFFRRELLPVLSDLRLAILLLLTIALFSVSGTVIEQGQSVAFYQSNYPEHPALFGFLTWKVLLTIGLDHVYRTWWFLALLILFGSSLAACTVNRQLPALRWFSRTWKFYSQPRQFQKLALSAELTRGSLSSLTPLLEKRRYKVYQDGESLYARKGLVGRIGPIVVHASMLLILAGAILGTLSGFIAQAMVPSGQSFQVTNILDAGPWAGSQIPKDWSVHVNRFWIDYTPDGVIDQFYSDLSVVDQQGKEVDRQTIHVNKPLKHKGVTFYQADWSIAAVNVQFNKSPVLEFPMRQLPTPGKARVWGTFLPTKPDGSDGVLVLANDLQGTVLIYDKTGKLISTVRKGTSTEVNGINLSLVDIVGSTGLQIKADPGIPVVYLGFGLMMIGVIMSYVSHSQVWALQHEGRFYVGGLTNRAQVAFERELLGVLDALETPSSLDSLPSANPQTVLNQ